MPLTGEYQPSRSASARKQAELYESTGGEKASDLRGRPIIVLTSVGSKTGKLRKTALMRVEHEGMYAVVASQGGAAKNPVWYNNLKAEPHVELQDGRHEARLRRPRSHGRREGRLVDACRGDLARLRQVSDEDRSADPGIRAYPID